MLRIQGNRKLVVPHIILWFFFRLSPKAHRHVSLFFYFIDDSAPNRTWHIKAETCSIFATTYYGQFVQNCNNWTNSVWTSYFWRICISVDFEHNSQSFRIACHNSENYICRFLFKHRCCKMKGNTVSRIATIHVGGLLSNLKKKK